MNRPWANHALAQELDTALAAVREAGLLCRSVQSLIDPGTLEKNDKSPVTVADFGSQALICRILGETFPADPVIGEEDSADLKIPGNEVTLTQVVNHVQVQQPQANAEEVCRWIDRGGAKEYSPRFWTLDPIDGTKGFLRKMQYAISLALIIDGQIEVAALGCPNLGSELSGDRGAGTVLLAIKGAGVWQVPLIEDVSATEQGDPVAIKASPQNDQTRIRFCESVESAHSSHSDSARIAERLAIVAEPARLDSQTKYAVVARGEAEAYLRLPRDNKYKEKIWDHAGGVLVVLEAGGRVTDITGKDLDFTQGYTLQNNLGVIVTNNLVHDAVLKTIEDLEIGKF